VKPTARDKHITGNKEDDYLSIADQYAKELIAIK
jgi:hypothetical protein